MHIANQHSDGASLSHSFVFLNQAMLCLLVFYVITIHVGLSHSIASAFHDCVEARQTRLQRRRRRLDILNYRSDTYDEDVIVPSWRRPIPGIPPSSLCAGGLCVGMTNGPHQGGNASYPMAWNGTSGTYLESLMTVPDLPKEQDGITYYIWTDIFFGDKSLGRMNQLVPQLLLGSVLDSSSGPPEYIPTWHTHDTWMFGAHYFFEIFNVSTMRADAHAAYGDLYPAFPGETIVTTFELSKDTDNVDTAKDGRMANLKPTWILTMTVLGDSTRKSTLKVDMPYMGMGQEWADPTESWLEPAYRNICINACWELYGAYSASHLPSRGATYNLTVHQPDQPIPYDFTTWEEDEGNGHCPSCKVDERHTPTTQNVDIRISVQSDIA